MIYTCIKYQGETPLNNQYTKVKQVLSGSGYDWEGGGKERGWRRMNMVDGFCICVWKYNNETCWNCSRKGGRGMRENDGGGESN
jgi:hypothetical protein